MNCPDEIAVVLLEILQHALLRMRTLGWEGDAAACAREADHVHNLPGLLANYAPDLLHFYWEVERKSLMQSDPKGAVIYATLWERLQALLPVANGFPPQAPATLVVSPPPPD